MLSRCFRSWADPDLIDIAKALALSAAAALLVGCGGGERHVVEMRNFAFEPAVLEASVGDTVEFVNRDIVPHTATAEGAWDSGSIAAGAQWSTVLEAAGTVEYVCTLHPSMRGRIEVR